MPFASLPLCQILLGGCRPRPYSISLSLSLFHQNLRSRPRSGVSIWACLAHSICSPDWLRRQAPSLPLPLTVRSQAHPPSFPSVRHRPFHSTDVAFVQVSLDSTIRCLTRTGPPEALRVATLSPHPRQKGPVKRVSMTSARQAIPVRIQWPPKCPGYLARLKAYRPLLSPRR